MQQQVQYLRDREADHQKVQQSFENDHERIPRLQVYWNIALRARKGNRDLGMDTIQAGYFVARQSLPTEA